jgi:polyhydroxyalkanoate synthesis regulator phasin
MVEQWEIIEHIEEKIADLEEELVEDFGITPRKAKEIMKETMDEFVE